jgi:hypothetical protein
LNHPTQATLVSASERRVFRNIGSAEGIIIATIIASHMSRKLVADAAQICPGIRIHIMGIVQPPSISISQHIERQKFHCKQARPRISLRLQRGETAWLGHIVILLGCGRGC